MWWLLAFLFLGVGLLLLVVASRWRVSAGATRGRIIAVDLERDGRPAPAMVDPSLGLTGRPDLLLETRDGMVPVEIKSGPAPATPHRSHVLQLAVYCRLTEVTYGRRPGYGVLQYADLAFSLPYTRALEKDLRQHIERLRVQDGSLPDRSHQDAARCSGCGYAAACDQCLAARRNREGGWL